MINFYFFAEMVDFCMMLCYNALTDERKTNLVG